MADVIDEALKAKSKAAEHEAQDARNSLETVTPQTPVRAERPTPASPAPSMFRFLETSAENTAWHAHAERTRAHAERAVLENSSSPLSATREKFSSGVRAKKEGEKRREGKGVRWFNDELAGGVWLWRRISSAGNDLDDEDDEDDGEDQLYGVEGSGGVHPGSVGPTPIFYFDSESWLPLPPQAEALVHAGLQEELNAILALRARAQHNAHLEPGRGSPAAENEEEEEEEEEGDADREEDRTHDFSALSPDAAAHELRMAALRRQLAEEEAAIELLEESQRRGVSGLRTGEGEEEHHGRHPRNAFLQHFGALPDDDEEEEEEGAALSSPRAFTTHSGGGNNRPTYRDPSSPSSPSKTKAEEVKSRLLSPTTRAVIVARERTEVEELAATMVQALCRGAGVRSVAGRAAAAAHHPRRRRQQQEEQQQEENQPQPQQFEQQQRHQQEGRRGPSSHFSSPRRSFSPPSSTSSSPASRQAPSQTVPPYPNRRGSSPLVGIRERRQVNSSSSSTHSSEIRGGRDLSTTMANSRAQSPSMQAWETRRCGGGGTSGGGTSGGGGPMKHTLSSATARRAAGGAAGGGCYPSVGATETEQRLRALDAAIADREQKLLARAVAPPKLAFFDDGIAIRVPRQESTPEEARTGDDCRRAAYLEERFLDSPHPLYPHLDDGRGAPQGSSKEKSSLLHVFRTSSAPGTRHGGWRPVHFEPTARGGGKGNGGLGEGGAGGSGSGGLLPRGDFFVPGAGVAGSSHGEHASFTYRKKAAWPGVPAATKACSGHDQSDERGRRPRGDHDGGAAERLRGGEVARHRDFDWHGRSLTFERTVPIKYMLPTP